MIARENEKQSTSRAPTRLDRWLGVGLGFSGLLVILSADGSPLADIRPGDLMALLSGVIFAIGSLRIRQAPDTPVIEQSFAFFVYGAVCALLLTRLPIDALGEPPSLAQLQTLLPWLVARLPAVFAGAGLFPSSWFL